jgi:pimeloyl-ACP methyl ester carboxylesterase
VTHRIGANGLEHHVLEWGSGRPIFLLHGYLDAAGTWDLVAPTLAAQGFRVLAPDLRGFGDGDRAPRGSYYHFADYVADVAALVDHLCPDVPVSIVGHSMGGTVATLFSGAFPERVSALANLEGLGPPDNAFEVGPVRMRRWLEDLRASERRGEPSPMQHAEARRRLGANHPGVPEAVLDHRLKHLVRDAGTGVVWRHDPLHRTTSPIPFFTKTFVEFARRVTCPVLFVSGGPKGWHPPDEEERLAAFARLERKSLDDAGHMLHWTRPAELAALLLAFFNAFTRGA